MRFWFDRCIPIKLARMIRAYAEPDHVVVHQDEDTRFQRKSSDVDILRTLAADKPPWVFLSHNYAMLNNKVERAALGQSSLTAFYLRESWGHIEMHEKACKFLHYWPSIIEAASRVRQPTVFEVPIKGKAPVIVSVTANLR